MQRLHEKVMLEKLCMEVYCRAHPLYALRNFLKAHRITTARDLRDMRSGSSVIVAGLVIFFHTPPTRSGQRVIFATLEDETGLLDIVILPGVQKRWARAIYTSEILTVAGRLRRQGRDGISISITANRIVEELSGSLEELILLIGS